MTISEVFARIKVIFRTKLESMGSFRAKPERNQIPNAKTHDFYKGFTCRLQVLEKAQAIVKGEFSVFSIDNVYLDDSFKWNKDPLTQIFAPLTFGKSLDYRKKSVAGNIKYLWEPSRHLQLVTLAVAYASGGESKYLGRIKDQLESWFDQCPYPLGPHWVSSLELGIRLINWSIIWSLIGGNDSIIFKDDSGQVFKRKWLNSIYQHTHFINGYYSGYSSANNHLIGEAAGVYVASKTWPLWSEFVIWGSVAKTILEEEAQYQTYQDGVNKEQAVSYQQFVLDFLLIPLLVGEKSHDNFSLVYRDNIEKMLDYLQSLMDISGNSPMIGDADDGFVFRLDWSDDYCPYKSLLATGAVIFNRGDFKLSSNGFDDKTKLLVGEHSEKIFNNLIANPALFDIKSYPDAGYHILGDLLGTPEECKLVVDAGPLGLGGIAAHGHADALSIWLTIKGVEFLIDPGTYAYHTEKKWRNYFRGTSAHNTVRVDNIDQSQIGGNFMWLQKAEAVCHSFTSDINESYIEISHNGYIKLADPVIHRRIIKVNKIEKCIIVEDYLECETDHEIEIFWHFHEECSFTRLPKSIQIQNQDVKLELIFDEQLADVNLISGDESLPLGWVSRRFDYKVPSTTVRCAQRITGNTKFTNVFKFNIL